MGGLALPRPVRRFQLFTPRQPDRFADRAVLERELHDCDDDRLRALHEVLRLDGLQHQVRITLWERREFVGYCGIFSEWNGADFTVEDALILQSLSKPLRDVMRVARARGGASPTALDVAQVLDAFDAPAFVVTTRGAVAHANRAARARYREIPAIVRKAARACRRSESVPGIQRAPVLLRGELHHLLLPREHPHAWPLPPSLARIAELLIEGHSDKEIAQATGLSHATVRTYVTRIFARLDVQNRRELMKRYGS